MFTLKFPQQEVAEGESNLDMAESKEKQGEVSQVEPAQTEKVASEEKAKEEVESQKLENENLDSWDVDRFKTTLKNFRDQERRFLSTERESKSKIEQLENTLNTLSTKLKGKEEEEAEKNKSVQELVEIRGKRISELELEVQKEKDAQEAKFASLQEKLEKQSTQINNLVDTTINEWPEKAKALVPGSETASEVRLERMLTAQPLIKDLIESSNNSDYRANGPDPSSNGRVKEKDAVELARKNRIYRAL